MLFICPKWTDPFPSWSYTVLGFTAATQGALNYAPY